MPRLILLGTALLLATALAAAQPKPEARPKPAPEAVAEKPAPEEPKAPEPVLEIKRTGPPDCFIEPVMTDAEIEKCRRAAEGRVEKK
jgi:hypothetical protein